MTNNNERINQTIKFLKWTKKYRGWWQLICEPGNEHMNLEMMRMLINRLAKEAFYETIFVLLEVHKDEPFMKCANDMLLKELIISEWKRGNKDGMIKKLTAHLE
ncbi:MAG: hypothetical protein FWE68_01410 [Defluviitaleaceae bacterium]|nr:hypothetical protein [Defluviitaleaceae bacterium]